MMVGVAQFGYLPAGRQGAQDFSAFLFFELWKPKSRLPLQAFIEESRDGFWGKNYVVLYLLSRRSEKMKTHPSVVGVAQFG